MSESNEGGLDHSRLAMHGEVVKTVPDRLTPGFRGTSEQSPDLPLGKPKTPTDAPSDLPPQGGIIQRRKRGDLTPPIPTNTQDSLEGQETTRNFTRRGQTPVNGTDNYILESIDHKGEPLPKDRTKALKHIFGRTAGILRSAQKRNGQPK